MAAGYRLIDTASVYRNEEAVGAAVRESGIPRKELFITTKVWIQEAGYEKTKKAFEASLSRLGLDTLDLYLIHMPFGDYYGSWRATEELYENGKIRAIGVCNFLPGPLMDLCVMQASLPWSIRWKCTRSARKRSHAGMRRSAAGMGTFCRGEKSWGKGAPHISPFSKSASTVGTPSLSLQRLLRLSHPCPQRPINEAYLKGHP
ncbi:MAG: aldo/keto reductase [Bilophila wadsworthia]